ncbi:hypothetical protein PIROE2DRAFT_4208 [Piromyces sp. E2]|nr:hypothetical protein PIROE2DRAFT_4208 [Piromyces sp. E2]|eukprot:OUM68201.1 hypothetical protein PIROE2DRAFT_4208 [Piromyces sp. E2]
MEQTNSTSDNDAASSSSNNISIPQLTDARKHEIRKKLLERQRQARLQNSNRNVGVTSTATDSSSSTASTSNTINTTTTENIAIPTSSGSNNNSSDNLKSKETENEKSPNPEMIKKAVAFLSSPKVQSAPTSRKHSFLLSKGCTKKEIELAEKEIEEKGLLSNQSFSQSSTPLSPTNTSIVTQSQAPPPLPPRTYQPQNIQIVYRNPPLTRFQKKEVMKPLRELYLQYTKYLKSRNNILNRYMLQIVEYCALFINDKNRDRVKQVKTIEEIEREKVKVKAKEKKMIENEKNEKENSEKESEHTKHGGGGDDDGEEVTSPEKEKKSGQRKAIKLKIHRKKEGDAEPVEEETQLKEKREDTSSTDVRTLSAAVQDYIDKTNDLENGCKDAIDTYAYDLERNSDLFTGSLGQTMKLSSEVYQMVSREVYYNSANSFYMDSYQPSDNDDGNGSVSLYARVNTIKSDIRRLKGMLLNHRNFPKYKQRALANNTNTTANVVVASPPSSSSST